MNTDEIKRKELIEDLTMVLERHTDELKDTNVLYMSTDTLKDIIRFLSEKPAGIDREVMRSAVKKYFATWTDRIINGDALETIRNFNADILQLIDDVSSKESEG